MCFKRRVKAFWNWFLANIQDINLAFDNNEPGLFLEEIQTELARVFGDIAFLMGGGDGNYELILSPEGNIDKYFLTHYWKEQAPQITGWVFHHFKPPTAISCDFRLDGFDISVNPEDFFVLPIFNDTNKLIDIEVFCEKISSVDVKAWYTYTFIMIDNCIGEGYTETAIGSIEKAKEKTEEMILLSEFYDFIVKGFANKGWQLFESPDIVVSSYSLSAKEDSKKYRDDIIYGSSTNTRLIASYLNGNSQYVDYMHSVGAEYVFLVYNHSSIDKKEKVSFRGKIEDALNLQLATNKVGLHLGGATGLDNSYIDFLVFDLDGFTAMVDEMLSNYDIDVKIVPFSDLY